MDYTVIRVSLDDYDKIKNRAVEQTVERGVHVPMVVLLHEVIEHYFNDNNFEF